MLGIFDSGLGGLTVLRHVRAQLPREDILYLADQAHVPYGDRDDADLAALLRDNVRFLETAGVDAIVMGCNTSCAVAARCGWPRASVPILDLIEAAAREVAASGARRVGVLATTATIRSGAYGRAIRHHAPAANVQEVAAPELVPLVESGTLRGPLARDAVRRALAPFRLPLDTLVLACTHYPLLDLEFATALGAGVRRLDPALAQAAAAVRFVAGRGARGGTGAARFVTTGAPAPYRRAVEDILGPLGAGAEFAHVSAAAIPFEPA